jgi:hypothetical protein
MTKFSARDAVLKRNTTGSTYVTIGQALEMGDIGSTRGLNDASVYGEEWMDFFGGQREGTEFTIRVAFDPADTQQAALATDYAGTTSKKFHLEVHPATTGVEFTALVVGEVFRAPREGGYEAEYTMKIVNPGVTTYTVT